MPKRKAGCERRSNEDGVCDAVAEGEVRKTKLVKSENEIKLRVAAQVEDEGRRRDLLEEYKHLTNDVLPAEARKHTGTATRWPIRLNHCFQRIILDNLFQDVWYPHLSIDGEDGSKPPKGGAMHRLRIDQLRLSRSAGNWTPDARRWRPHRSRTERALPGLARQATTWKTTRSQATNS